MTLHHVYCRAIPYYRTKIIESDFIHRESLASFVTRIAWDHRLPVARLLKAELSYLKWGSGDFDKHLFFPNTDEEHHLTKFMEKTCHFRDVSRAAYALPSLGKELDFERELPIVYEKHWCPVCYFVDRNSAILHDRLYWQLKGNLICWVHNCQLAFVCYYCGNPQPTINQNHPVGYCDDCGRFLGLPEYYGDAETDQSTYMTAFYKDCMRDDGATIQGCQIKFEFMHINSNLSFATMAQTYGVDEDFVRKFLKANVKPSWWVCKHIIVEWNNRSWDFVEPSFDLAQSSKNIKPVNVAAVKEYLKAVLKNDDLLCSRETIAEKFGVTTSFLRTHFPDEVSTIYIRYLKARTSTITTGTLKGYLREAVQMAHQEGTSLTWETLLAAIPDDFFRKYTYRNIQQMISKVLDELHSKNKRSKKTPGKP